MNTLLNTRNLGILLLLEILLFVALLMLVKAEPVEAGDVHRDNTGRQ